MITYNYSILFADGEQEFGTFRDDKERTLRTIAGEIFRAYAILKATPEGTLIDSDQADTFEIWVKGRLAATIVITH